MKKNKILAAAMASVMIAGALSGCGSGSDDNLTPSDNIQPPVFNPSDNIQPPVYGAPPPQSLMVDLPLTAFLE